MTIILLFISKLRFFILVVCNFVLCKFPDRARQALEYVDHVATSTCSGGVEETLPIQFDHTVWERYANVAVNTANLLTKIIIQSKYIETIYGKPSGS